MGFAALYPSYVLSTSGNGKRECSLADHKHSDGTESAHRQSIWACRLINKIRHRLDERRAQRKGENAADRAARSTARATWAIAILTAATIGVGISQYITFNRQLSVMHGQLDALEADQRPWAFATNVIVSRPIVHDDKGTHISLRFDLINGGRSPALQTSARFRAYLRSLNYRAEEQIVCKDAEPTEIGDTLFPDKPLSRETGWLIPTQEINEAKARGTMIVPFIVACIAYQFPRTREYHTTPYEFILGLAVGSTKWPCCSFPIEEKEIIPADVQLSVLPVTPPN